MLNGEYMLGKVADLPSQLLQSLSLKDSIPAFDGVEDVVVIGMGGSGIVGDFISTVVRDRYVRVVKSSDMPRVDASTMVIAITYSGSTRETLAAVRKAREYTEKVVMITSSREIEGLCSELGIGYVRVVNNTYSRASLGYMLAPALLALENARILSSACKDIKEASDLLSTIAGDGMRLDMLKVRLLGRSLVVVYGDEFTRAAAIRWKQMLNENAKLQCYYDIYPELLHNEIEVWHGQGSHEDAALVMLRDDAYEREQGENGYDLYAAINKSKRLLSSKGMNIIELWSVGRSPLTRLLSLSYIGDLLSVHLAYARGVDPTRIPNIDYIKKGV
ncbi:MAG: SIS domain-containing protein [Candidatus Nitrosocaldus sp.]|nr:SIS domain-containing protein [Candidatus Nitrosocaldus sp.]MDW7999494.1 SIS domain-containing protein [Candidatus Nitrosocaldus sp.]